MGLNLSASVHGLYQQPSQEMVKAMINKSGNMHDNIENLFPYLLAVFYLLKSSYCLAFPQQPYLFLLPSHLSAFAFLDSYK